jgi:hypothetical protein
MAQEQVTSYELPRHVVRYVEEELRMYNAMKTAIPLLEQDYLNILQKSRQFSMIPGGGGEHDKLGNDAIKLVTIQNKSAEYTRRTERIEMGLRLCVEEEKKLVTAKYFSGFNYRDEEVLQQLHYGFRNRYFEVKRAALYKFAIVFGLV